MSKSKASVEFLVFYRRAQIAYALNPFVACVRFDLDNPWEFGLFGLQESASVARVRR